MVTAKGARRGFTVQVSALPDNERLIFKLILSVSQKTASREYFYELAGDSSGSSADIMVTDDTQAAALRNNPDRSAAMTTVFVVDAAGIVENAPTIQRPLIATRVLSVLDTVAAQLESQKHASGSTTAEEHGVDRECVANHEDSTLQSDDAGTAIEFSISEEEACELAIVHDEALSNPANNETTTKASKSDDKNVSSNPIRPSAVITKFPRTAVVAEKPVHEPASAENSEQPNPSFPRALVVDDSASVRKQIELELAFFDVNVDYAEDGETALKLSGETHYDIAFLDVVLPDIDGFQICKNIKSTTPDVSVIMLTGKATQADKIKGKLAGCDDYLVKPVGRNTFQNTVKNYLRERQAEENYGEKLI